MRRAFSARFIGLALALLCACSGPATTPPPFDPGGWVCYFGPAIPPGELAAVDLAILEPDEWPDVRNLAPAKKIGYLSIGECGTYRPYWPLIRNKPWVGKENPNWPGDIAVDIRSEEWQALLLDTAIASIVARGFNGLFLDTLNEAVYGEISNAPGSAGKIDAAAALIRKIRDRYPGLTLLTNSGIDILEKIDTHIDAVLVEDLATLYDFSARAYGPQDPEATQWILDRLTAFQRRTGKTVFVIDYATAEQPDLIRRSRELCMAHRFRLYIAEIDLRRLYRAG
ncbi:MAG: hypothetical protein A3G34_07005 [Candidatus Lindowbacteria bacterium RIFCSPLOWO2_12_FULL_62_27]|nr:MAG: hypothetical protein A3G34_07005 [Candidatus Lindowbacteria bacterium RIFCSPLOWO2_12_FULL_62_27]